MPFSMLVARDILPQPGSITWVPGVMRHLISACACPQCRSRRAHPDRVFHRQLRQLLPQLDERQRRWIVALEAQRLGHGGTRQLATITGMSAHTIRRGRRELARLGGRTPPASRIRAPGGGRPGAERRDPELVPTLTALLAPETAGDPMSAAKYKRSSLRTLSARLQAAGHPASPATVARLLRQLGYSPKANVRRTEARTAPPERNAQFQHIVAQRDQAHATGTPVISVDSKKKK
jgi:hypothetical protein